MTTRIILAALALTVAACGSDDNNASTQQSREAANKKALLQYASCMREHGVDMPDPTFTSDGGVQMQMGSKDGKIDRKTMDAAQQACEKYQKQVKSPSGARNPGTDKEVRKKALAHTQCMREHGIDMPDPQFGNGTVRMQLGKGIDPNSAKFQAAQKACQATEPIGKGGLATSSRDGQ